MIFVPSVNTVCDFIIMGFAIQEPVIAELKNVHIALEATLEDYMDKAEEIAEQIVEELLYYKQYKNPLLEARDYVSSVLRTYADARLEEAAGIVRDEATKEEFPDLCESLIRATNKIRALKSGGKV